MWELLFGLKECLHYMIASFNDVKGTRCKDNKDAQPCSCCRASLGGHIRDFFGTKSSPHVHYVLTLDKSAKSVPSSIHQNQSFSNISLGLSADKGFPTHMHLPQTTQTGKHAAENPTCCFNKAYEARKHQKMDCQQELHPYIQRFKAALAQFAGVCAFCKVWNVESTYHSILKCPTMLHHPDLSLTQDTYLVWQKMLSYKDNHGSVCYFCHIPQCDDTLHPTFAFNAEACEHPDILSGSTYALFHHLWWLPLAQQHFSCHWPTFKHFVNWLNAKPVAGHKTNMGALFL